MSNISNTMVITDSSLSQVSRELIDKRVYKEGLIQIVGSPVIYNGVASNISNSSYFTYSDFSFGSNLHSAKITFNGTYVPEAIAHTSYAYDINGLTLEFTPTSITLKYNSVVIKQFPNLALSLENVVSTSAEFTNTYLGEDLESQECKFIVILNGTTYTDTVNVPDPINFSSLTSLVLGNNSTHDGYWEGNINLTSFALYQNERILYTPSAKNSFKFTKIMVADSTNPLTDTSTPALNHVYECPVTEISRTENNVLLTTTIPEGAFLNIAQLGLYYTDDNGIHLFSTIGGLAVKKTNDLIYNLIIHVKLDINVVNTVAMPEIVIKEKPYTNFSKFLTVKQVYVYITENMERMIKLNALGKGSYTDGAMTEHKPVGVGYNKAQVYYRLQSDLALWEDNFVATNNYAKVKTKFTPYTTEYFDSVNIVKVGDVYLDEKTGLLSTLSENNYAYTQLFPLSINNNWKLTIDFTTSSNVTTKQSVITFSADSTGQPLTLGIENNRCALKVEGNDGSSVINNTSLFIVHGLKKYEVVIEYTNNIYHVSYAVDGTYHENVYTFASTKPLNTVSKTLFGVGYTGTATQYPFLGTLDLYNTNMVTSMYSNGTVLTSTYDFLSETTFNTSLLDYFHLPVYAHSYFLVNNLGFDGSSYLEEYEGAFKGFNDRVYFDNPKGFTLCAKVHLFDENNKVLLAKGSVESDEYYFVLEQKDNSLLFNLYLDDATVTLKKGFTVQNIRGFIEHPINITVTCDGNQYAPTFRMYKNNELLDTYVLPTNSTKNVSDMYLMNHETFTEDDNLEVHTVYDIICFEGELTSNEIYYINNVLDTNF